MDKCDFFLPTPLVVAWVNRWTFLPMHASVAAWVFRWQVSPPLLLPPLPHLQICQRPLTKTWFQRPLTIETENAVSGGWHVGLSLSMRSCFSFKLKVFFGSFIFFLCYTIRKIYFCPLSIFFVHGGRSFFVLDGSLYPLFEQVGGG